ncbi:MAG: cobalt ECF transporter T component CbiQ [Methanomicrobiales archaeon]|nr:cobalt ECF transporter T component CbiQ [Methanomicrobiales archaeon]
MENILDEIASENALRHIDPRVKLVLGIGSILIAVSSSGPIAPVSIAVGLALATLFLARIPVKMYLTLLAIPLTFALSGALIILFMTGTGPTLFTFTLGGFALRATTGGAALAVLTVARTFGGMCALFFIALTTPAVDLFSVLRSLRLPSEFIDLAMLVYRFIFILIGEAIAIRNAQVMRHGYADLRSSMRSFSMLGAMLFLRSWDRGEDLVLAMDARCYDGKMEMHRGKWTAPAVGLFGAGAFLAAVTILAWYAGGFTFWGP